MTNLTYDAQLAEMADLRREIAKAEREAEAANQHVRELKARFAEMKRGARLRFITQYADGKELPEGVSMTRTKFYDYDAAEILETALAEGIEEVIRRPPPELNRARFREMLKDGLEIEGVTYGERMNVNIGNAAMTDAWARREFARQQEESNDV